MSFTPTVVSLNTHREVRCEQLLGLTYEISGDAETDYNKTRELYTPENIQLIADAFEAVCDVSELPALLELTSFNPDNPLERKVSLHAFNFGRLGHNAGDYAAYQMMRHAHRWPLDGTLNHSGNSEGRMYRETGRVIHFTIGNTFGAPLPSIYSTLTEDVITRIYKTWIGEDF